MFAAIIAKLQRNLGHARNRYRLVTVRVGQRIGVPLAIVALIEPERDLAVLQLLDGVLPPLAAEDEKVVATAALERIVSRAADNDIVSTSADNAIVAAVAEEKVVVLVDQEQIVVTATLLPILIAILEIPDDGRTRNIITSGVVAFLDDVIDFIRDDFRNVASLVNGTEQNESVLLDKNVWIV